MGDNTAAMFGRSRSRGPLRRLLGLIGLSRLALLAWAWRNRHDVAGWARLLRRAPASVGEPATRNALLVEAKVRAAITADATTRAAGLDVEMVGSVPHVTATRGTQAERGVALAKLRQRRPDVVIEASPPSP